MRVKISRSYNGMPDGAKAGDEIDIDDDEFAEQRRLGNVERLGPQADQGNKANPNQPPQEHLRGQAGQPFDRPQANQGQDRPTAVDPVGTDDWRGQDRSDK